ncbi:MAG TPA: alpha/beta hydrolase, partial [Candidatus Wallbacteria bacterium]|nr:alpha/beta hydrolase [Candidatus Wallbacteria bacterium]
KRKTAEHKVFECDAGLMDKMEFFDKNQFASDIVVQTCSVWRRFKSEVIDAMNCSDIAVLDKVWESSYGLSFDADAFAEPFDKPSMIVCGANDSVTGYEDAFGVLKNFTRASYSVIERAGHYLQIERPALFGSLVSDWLERFEIYRNSGH